MMDSEDLINSDEEPVEKEAAAPSRVSHPQPEEDQASVPPEQKSIDDNVGTFEGDDKTEASNELPDAPLMPADSQLSGEQHTVVNAEDTCDWFPQVAQQDIPPTHSNHTSNMDVSNVLKPPSQPNFQASPLKEERGGSADADPSLNFKVPPHTEQMELDNTPSDAPMEQGFDKVDGGKAGIDATCGVDHMDFQFGSGGEEATTNDTQDVMMGGAGSIDNQEDVPMRDANADFGSSNDASREDLDMTDCERDVDNDQTMAEAPSTTTGQDNNFDGNLPAPNKNPSPSPFSSVRPTSFSFNPSTNAPSATFPSGYSTQTKISDAYSVTGPQNPRALPDFSPRASAYTPFRSSPLNPASQLAAGASPSSSGGQSVPATVPRLDEAPSAARLPPTSTRQPSPIKGGGKAPPFDFKAWAERRFREGTLPITPSPTSSTHQEQVNHGPQGGQTSNGPDKKPTSSSVSRERSPNFVPKATFKLPGTGTGHEMKGSPSSNESSARNRGSVSSPAKSPNPGSSTAPRSATNPKGQIEEDFDPLELEDDEVEPQEKETGKKVAKEKSRVQLLANELMDEMAGTGAGFHQMCCEIVEAEARLDRAPVGTMAFAEATRDLANVLMKATEYSLDDDLNTRIDAERQTAKMEVAALRNQLDAERDRQPTPDEPKPDPAPAAPMSTPVADALKKLGSV